MNEAGLWQYLRKGLSGTWMPTRIESSAGNGVPDVYYSVPGKGGWIELKYIPKWPKRPTTKVKLPLRPEQKLWIKQHGELTGRVFVLVRIEDDFFLVNHRQIEEACEGWDTADWLTKPQNFWPNKIDFKELRSDLNGL